MLSLCNKESLALPPVWKLKCVWQRGLGIFVSTPRFEHTCNFLSPYLHYNILKYAYFYIVSKSPEKKGVLMYRFCLVTRMNEGIQTCRIQHKVKTLEKIIYYTWIEMGSSLTRGPDCALSSQPELCLCSTEPSAAQRALQGPLDTNYSFHNCYN